MRKHGSRAAALGGAAAFVTLVITVTVSWALILETYYCHRLRTSGESGRIEAVKEFVRLECLSSVPPLVEAFRSDPSAAVRKAALRGLETARLGGHEELVLQAVRTVLWEAVERASPDGFEAQGQLVIVVTRSGPAFRVQMKFSDGVPHQTVVAAIDAFSALELDHVSLYGGGSSRGIVW